MKKIILLVFAIFLLSACGTEVKQDNTNSSTWVVENSISTEVNSGTTNETLLNNEEQMTKKIGVQNEPLQNWDIVATMKTTNGTIKIKLFRTLVPNTVNNFIWLAQKWYYNGIIFHRTINNFMIQGGDPTWTWMWWESIYWEKFNDEFNPELTNIRWSISMANSWKNTNWSQFFINQKDNNFLDNKHSVFGQVIEWIDNVDKIAKTQTWANDKPTKDIKIIEIKVQKYNSGKYEDYKIDEAEKVKQYKERIKKESEAKKTWKVKAWDTVSVNYKLTLEDWTEVDNSYKRWTPLDFTVDGQMVIKWFNEWVKWMKVWEKKKLEISPKDWYGEYNAKNVEKVPKEQLKSFVEAWVELKVWNKLPTQYGNFVIKAVSEKDITIDLNHELAWKKLIFEVELVEIK